MNRNHRPAYDALRRVELFAPCTDNELKHVLALTTPLRARAGEILATEGAAVREFLITVTGCVDVTVQGETLMTLDATTCWAKPHSDTPTHTGATITARTDLDLLVSSPRELRQLLDTIPAITRRLLRYASPPSVHLGATPTPTPSPS